MPSQLKTGRAKICVRLLIFLIGNTMQKRVPLAAEASAGSHLGTALCAYSNPTSCAFEQRGVWDGLATRVLNKPYRPRTDRTRKASTIE